MITHPRVSKGSKYYCLSRNYSSFSGIKADKQTGLAKPPHSIFIPTPPPLLYSGVGLGQHSPCTLPSHPFE